MGVRRGGEAEEALRAALGADSCMAALAATVRNYIAHEAIARRSLQVLELLSRQRGRAARR